MTFEDHLVGLLFFAAATGSSFAAAAIVTRRRLNSLPPAPRILAFGMLGAAALIVVHLAPGVLGVLDRWTAGAAGLLVLVAATRVPPTRERREATQPAAPSSGRLSLALAGAAVVPVTLAILATVRDRTSHAIDNVDWMSFTLPGIAQWQQSGSFFDTTQFLPFFPVATYPHNGDVMYLAAILPWSNDAFVVFVSLPILALTAVAVYALARELRAPAATAAIAAAVVLSVRGVTFPVLQTGKPDGFMLAAFAAGLVFLVRHARTAERSDLLLAGLGLGLAFGARWYGLSTVAVVIAVWGASRLLARQPVRETLTQGGLLVGSVLAAGGFWLIRNLVVAGNPLVTVDVSPFGVQLLDAPIDPYRERYGTTLFEHLDDLDILRTYALPDYADALGAPGLVLLIGLAVAAAIALRRGFPPRGQAAVVLALAAAAAGIVAAYLITPASAQGFPDRPFDGLIGGNSRWMMPALPAAAGAAAWAASASRRVRPVAEIVAIVAIAGGLSKTFDLTAEQVLGMAALLVLAGAAGFAVYATRSRLRTAPVGPLVAAFLALALVAGGLVYTDRVQRTFGQARYAGLEPTADWLTANAPEGHRVGVAGSWSNGFVPTAAMFGPRFGNRVAFVGRVDGGLLMPHAGKRAFVEALRRGRYDLLLVGRLGKSPLEYAPADLDRDPGAFNEEVVPPQRWAEGEGFTVVAASNRFLLLSR